MQNCYNNGQKVMKQDIYIRIQTPEVVSVKEESDDQTYAEELVTTTLTSIEDNHNCVQSLQDHNQNPLLSSPLAKSSTISSSPSANSDSGHCSRASPDITLLTTTANGAIQSMASASDESPINYHHNWAMCGNDGSRVISSQSCKSSSSSATAASAALAAQAAYLNSSSFSTSNPQTPQNVYNCYGYTSTFGNTSVGSQSLSSCQQSGLDYTYPGFAHTGGYGSAYYNNGYPSYIPNTTNTINNSPSPSPLTLSSTTNSVTTPTYPLPQLSRESGYTSTFGNSGVGSQSLSSCQQSGLDYIYPGFGHSGSYGPAYYNSGYSSYIPNASNTITNSPSPSPLTLSSTTNSVTTPTYQLSQLAHESDNCASPIKTENRQNVSNTGTKKGTSKSGRGRGRRQNNPSPDPEHDLERVFLWDLDNTLVKYLTLLNEPINPMERVLGEEIEHFINQFAEQHFFYSDLEKVDQGNLDDLISDDNGQDISNYDFQNDGFCTNITYGNGGLAMGCQAVKGAVDLRKQSFRYRRIKELYNVYKNNIQGLLSTHERDQLYKIRDIYNRLDNSPTPDAIKCLKLINSRPKSLNVLVSNMSLVHTLAVVMLFDLDSYFYPENIYSAGIINKENTFVKIIQKFGKKCSYVAIGDGRDEEMAAKQLDIPFWPVRGVHDIKTLLHYALERDHL
ncbi:eyes absent homolog 1-like isoform X2 [Oppia nitens]|uniref:eyes absent homolog 1-like isoform X2 n=1 Tax=Oppia nitens TaxID=1686743 RepID=UPI0023DBCE52|nr:eyes absent homolog 1-like isoform X2 [Oppia nitens]